MSDVAIVWLVLHDKETAIELGRKLLDERLIAGYNLMPIESAFWWNGQILEEQETLMLLKTLGEHAEAINARVTSLTGAAVPDGFAVRPSAMSSEFAQWVRQEAAPTT